MRSDIENTLQKLHEFERFGSKLGLERMTRLLELLGNPHEGLEVIHVAGTNGKGSVCRYVYGVLTAAGYNAGLYTSPFLERFNERIEAGGSCISDEDLSACSKEVLAAARKMTDAGEESPTEFEVVTAIAFVYFREKKCRPVVLEVGLGGRGDSTNVCESPLVTAITSISMDHMDRLGNTIEEIAREKAGIIKRERPVAVSARDERALAVIREVADEKNAEVIISGEMPIIIREETLEGSVFDADTGGETLRGLKISMAGEHQVENAAEALAVLGLFERESGEKLPEAAIRQGLAEARQPGRLEVLSAKDQRPQVLIDGAHNEDGAKKLADAVCCLCPDWASTPAAKGKTGRESRILMVVGMLADKDAEAVTDNFLRITDKFIATEPDNPRRLPAEKLAALLESKGAVCAAAKTPEEACRLAFAKAEEEGDEAVVFAGSLYLIGKIRSILKNV